MGLNVVLFFLKNAGCVRRHGAFRAIDHRQHFILHAHQLFCLFQRFPIFCRDQRHRISQIMGQTAYRDQGILVFFQMADLIYAFCRYILRRKDADHTVKCLCLGGVNRQHSGTGILAAHGTAVHHAV